MIKEEHSYPAQENECGPIPTSPEEIEAAKQAFINHITKSPINRGTIVKAWELFELTQYAGNRSTYAFGKKGDFHISEIVRGLRDGRHIDITTASLGHFTFKLMTYGSLNLPSGLGVLLQDLQGEELERAIEYCKKMDTVGRSSGDLDKKIPDE